MKVKEADGRIRLVEAKAVGKRSKAETVDMKIVGLVPRFGTEAEDYYIGMDSKNQYFLLVGSKAMNPNDSYLFNDLAEFGDYEAF